jgi:N-acetylneuraminate synthase
VVKIGKRFIDKASPTYMIAEIGINHNGDLDTAKKLIKVAVESGFDAVKFQKRTVEIVYSENELLQSRPNHFGETNGDLKRGLEFGRYEYEQIAELCTDLNVDWFASPWDLQSIEFLEELGVVAHKVASACLSDSKLLTKLAETGKPVFLSTGMSTMDQIRTAVGFFDPNSLVVMHAVSVYPASLEQLNLSWIDELKQEFPHLPIGYSGHEPSVLPSVVAVAKHGAVCVERHITLDRSMWGSDQSASLEPDGMSRLIKYIRALPLMEGSGAKRILEEEIPIQKKLRRVSDF